MTERQALKLSGQHDEIRTEAAAMGFTKEQVCVPCFLVANALRTKQAPLLTACTLALLLVRIVSIGRSRRRSSWQGPDL